MRFIPGTCSPFSLLLPSPPIFTTTARRQYYPTVTAKTCRERDAYVSRSRYSVHGPGQYEGIQKLIRDRESLVAVGTLNQEIYPRARDLNTHSWHNLHL